MSATDCLYKITITLKEPIERNGIYIPYINVPCGKCDRCLQRRKMEWSFRMNYEMEQSKTAYFVTLTYSPETVPINKWGIKTLVPTRAYDLKLKAMEHNRKRITKKFKDQYPDVSIEGFFKRLRQNQKRSKYTKEHIYNNLKQNDKILFYAAGEYGENNTKRPHYHAIIFNASEVNIHKSWCITNKKNNTMIPIGDVQVKKAEEGNIAYVMKYLDKRLDNEQDPNRYPEFNTMSEGIGKGYIDKFKSWHQRNPEILFVKNKKGIMIPMCKYYRHKIFTEDQRKEQAIMVTELMEQIKKDGIEKMGSFGYFEYINNVKKYNKIQFKKKIKKRIVD